MTEQEMVQAALDAGFAGAEIIDTSEIQFDSEFRRYCEENLCGQYNVNYSCPPDCGTPEEMKARLLAHRRALVLQSLWEIDFHDGAAVKKAKAGHNKNAVALRKKFREAGIPGLLCGASCCTLCSPCAKQRGEPCRFPEDRWSCLSSYCVFVKKLADSAHVDYWLGENLVAFFGLYAFE